MYGGKAILNKQVLSCLRKVAVVSEELIVNGELVPDCWRNYRESAFANIELSFRNKTFGNG